jgi:hypothetical protein
MEPIRHTLTARIGYLKMYREELDELVGMFERCCEKVTISDSKYRYMSLEEMKEKLPARIKDLDIRGQNPSVRFLINQTEMSIAYNPPAQVAFNELRTEEITDAADGLFYKLKDFLKAYQQPGFPKTVIGAIISVIGAFGFALYHTGVNKAGQQTIGSPTGFFICLATFVIFVLMSRSPGNYLTLEAKRDAASFFVRNREDFAKHAVLSLISGMIGAVVGYLVGHFSK